MKKLLEKGLLPAHVDPNDIVDAPACLRIGHGQERNILPNDGEAPEEEEEGTRSTGAKRAKRSKKAASESDSNSNCDISDINYESEEDGQEQHPSELVRSSSEEY